MNKKERIKNSQLKIRLINEKIKTLDINSKIYKGNLIKLKEELLFAYLDITNYMIHLSKFKEAIEFYEKILLLIEEDVFMNSSYSKKVYNIYNKMGIAFLSQKDYFKGILFLRKAARLLRDNSKTKEIYNIKLANIYNRIGTSFFDTRHYDLAKKNINLAISTNPYNYIFYANLARVMSNLSEHETSIKNYKKALKLMKETQSDIENYYIEMSKIYSEIGTNLFHLKKYIEAIKEYKTAIEHLETHSDKTYERNLNLSELHNKIGNTYSCMKKYTVAIKSYKTALKLTPSSYIFYGNLGVSFIKSKNYLKAIKNYKEAIKIIEKNPVDIEHFNAKLSFFYSGIGTSLIHLGEISEASTAYKKAVETIKNEISLLDKKSSTYKKNLKECKIILYDYQENLRLLKEEEKIILKHFSNNKIKNDTNMLTQ